MDQHTLRTDENTTQQALARMEFPKVMGKGAGWKWYCNQKNNSYFKTMLTKHWLTQVLSSDFKRHLFILAGVFLFTGPPLLTLKSWESWVEEKMTSDSLV